MFNKILKQFTKYLLFPQNSLKQRAISSGVWLGFSRMLNKILLLVRAIILARMLSPKDFGLFGISLAVLSLLQTFSQPGTGEALIQKKDDIAPYLDAAWTIKIIRGISLALFLYFCAPFASRFFAEPQIITLIYIIAASLIIGGIGNQGIIYFAKDLNFRKAFIYEISGVITDFCVSLILVFILHNALALAYGYLAGIFTLTVVSYFIHPYRPKFKIDLPKIKELTRFGRWVWLYTIFNYILSDGISFFIGKVLGVISLGLYQMALKISALAAGEISAVFSSVGFSFYSKLQDDASKLKEAYIKTLKINNLLIFPICVFLYGMSPLIVHVLLGEKWQGIVWLIRIFSLLGLFTSLSTINNTFFKSMGNPNLTAKFQIIKLILISSIIYFVTVKFGLIGVSILILIVNIAISPFECAIIFKKLGLRINIILKIILFPLANSIITITVIFLINKWLVVHINIISFIFLTFLSVILYLFTTFISDQIFHFGIKRLFNKNYLLNLFVTK